MTIYLGEKAVGAGTIKATKAVAGDVLHDGTLVGNGNTEPLGVDKQVIATTNQVANLSAALHEEIDGKQDKLAPGDGIKIVDNVISATAAKAEWGKITGDINNQTDLQDALGTKQDSLTAGDGISIEGNVISNTRTNAEWGNITGDINNQTDLQDALGDAISAHNAATNAHSNIRGVAGGLATLDNNAKVPMAQINDALLGNVSYQGLWNAQDNVPYLADPSGDIQLPKGHYYITSVAGDRFGLHFDVGDWVISTGEGWSKVDNTDAVSAVNGMTGNVVLNASDVDAYTKAEVDDKFAEVNTQINTNTEAIADAKDDINDLQTQINTRTRVIIRRWN